MKRPPRIIPFPLSGRCVYALPRASLPSSNSNNAATEYIELCSPRTQRGSNATSDGRGVPLSLAANSYYQKRYASSSRTPQLNSGGSTAFTFNNGDLIIRPVMSTTPGSVRHQRIVDVTGVQTSFYTASERDASARATVDEAVQSMHLHDGSEVPHLRRGDVATGRLVVLCVNASMAGHARDQPVPAHRAAKNTAVVVNASVFLLRQSRLEFRSMEEALQMAKMLAESCMGVTSAPSSSSSSVRMASIVKDGSVVGMRMVML